MQLNYHLAAECVHFKGCGKIIAKWSLLLRVWIGTTSNVTRRGRTQQGLFFRFQAVHSRGYSSFFRPYTAGVILRFLGRTQQGLFFVFQAVHTRGYSSFFRPYTPGAKCPLFMLYTAQNTGTRSVIMNISLYQYVECRLNPTTNTTGLHYRDPAVLMVRTTYNPIVKQQAHFSSSM